ncbi:MAG: hypothetical protein HWN81_11030 [Candidatus Lokiarchaeota archaeon]|nr:hypothetical protein [Candidatus Lokiarchaeota archaeon]
MNNSLKTTSITSMLQDPFTLNFDFLRNFFQKNYQSSLDFDIPTYFRYGDSDGVITDDTIFSEDNLLYYNSLMKMEIDERETFTIYLELKNTTLWYTGDINNYKYGFVKSIDNTTGEILDDNRYLIDNLLPIFLIIENMGGAIKTISINGKSPIDSINEMFFLINSTEFWDNRSTHNGFFNSNSSIIKNTESNFYSILANLLIHRTYYDLNLDDSIRDRALELANLTMIDIINKMWDSDDEAFYHSADADWSSTGQQLNYHLNTNALGIITLLEFWIISGMKNDSIYLQRAKDLYNRLETELYDPVNTLYKNIGQADWNTIWDDNLTLDSNAMMMRACLKFFEVSGNISYYDRAVNMSKSIEANLYDTMINAYNFSFMETSSDKSFNSNLKLSKAYLDAFDIYKSTFLDGVYNVSGEVPDFIFNQDKMNLTSVYSFEKNRRYYNPDNQSYVPFTIRYDITYATINHIIKYPNGTYFEQFQDVINSTTASYTFNYTIKENLPIGDGYYIYVWANTSYFKLTQSLKRFNVVSGLINKSLEGLPTILYQGPIINVSLIINYTRFENLTLTASLEGEQLLKYPSQEIDFTTMEEIRIDFNLTAKFGATPGITEIFFNIKKDNIVYLELKKVIEIGYAFEYSNLIYQRKVVSGDSISVSMNLKNFLPDAVQTLNVSFTGVEENYIEDYIQEETLNENEIKTISYSLKSLKSINNETIRIKMSLLINTTEFFSKVFAVEVVPKFALLSVSFADKIPQGSPAYLIIIIQNNQENSEDFSLYLNGKRISTNLEVLGTGKNRIVAKITPSINPYELGTKNYRFVLKDSSDIEIERFYFEIVLEVSILNLILFYIIPILVPIGLILFFKNRDIKHKKLRR